MAVTVARLLNQVAGNKRHTVTAVTMDSSYVAAGEALTANQLGLGRVESAQVQNSGGLVGEYDISASKILARWTGDATASVLAQPSSTTDLATVVFNVDAWGY